MGWGKVLNKKYEKKRKIPKNKIKYKTIINASTRMSTLLQLENNLGQEKPSCLSFYMNLY